MENEESSYGRRYNPTQGFDLLQISPNWFLGNWTLDPSLKWALARFDACALTYMETSLKPVPNAKECVFDGTYYKITITNYISKTSLYTTFRMYPSGPWPLKILMFALLVTREIATYS